MRKRIFVIDGKNMFCRGYHIAKSHGKPALGFLLEMVMNIKKMHPASRMVFTFDTTKSERRLALYPEYKGNRKSSLTPEEYEVFKQTEGRFIEILGATGCTLMTGHGYEADDYISCFCHMLKMGHDVVIVSTDNDLYQLINDCVRVYDPFKGIFISPDNFAQVVGIPLDKFLDYKCMIGDDSDNIKNFDRIGEGTAKKYVDAYGSYDSIVKAIEAMPEKSRKKNDVTLLNRSVYNLNKSLIDLSLNYEDRKLKLLIKGFVDSTIADDKKLNNVLASYDLSQYFYPMKGLRLTNVLGNNG